MSEPEFDLFVIGAGSAGVRCGRLAAQRGVRVAVAENDAPGGTCVNRGCIPKKLYSYAAHYHEDFEDARGYGWRVGAASFDWPTLKRRRAAEIERLNAVYAGVLEMAGATLLRGQARIVEPGVVELTDAGGTRRHRARRIVIATGAEPAVPPWPGAALAVSSDEMFDLPAFPHRLAVIGGGYIACEFASIFRGLGAEVTQVYRGTHVLRGFDDDVRAFVAAEMAKKGVALHAARRVARLERADAGVLLVLDDGTELQADTVLQAIGRVPRTRGLGLEALGVALDANGAVRVDEGYATNVPGLHAIGDVIDRVQLTPVALAEAMALIDRLYGDGTRQVDYEHVPTAVFTHPNIGTVGLSEADARARYERVRVYRSDFRALKHTLTGRGERTLVKLVVDAASDRVVGLHMVGADAGEIVQGFAVAMRAGATKACFDSTIGIHPTMAEEFVTLREPVMA
ncbi:MAG: glutathione-disulfide reductase [Proteobacteria bacterium]|nr:glutathione-disulfide reductase [Pseudomonadota bacterium]